MKARGTCLEEYLRLLTSHASPGQQEFVRFFLDKYHVEVSGGPFAAKYDAAQVQAVLAYLDSDRPLDRPLRKEFVAVLRPLLTPGYSAQVRQQKRKRMAHKVSVQKTALRLGGWSAQAADDKISESLGLSVDALRKKIQPSRIRGGKAKSQLNKTKT